MKKTVSKEELDLALEEIAKYYNFGFSAVESQVEFIEACLNPNYKEIVLIAGRGWGKDLVIGMYLYHLCMNNANIRVLFICPFYKQINNFFSQVINGVNDETGERFIPMGVPGKPTFIINDSKKTIKFKNGSIITGVSAENPENIRSFRGNIVVLNEAADIPENTIKTQVYPVIKKALKTGIRPKVIYVGTPKGKNFLYRKFVEGNHKPTNMTRKWYDPVLLKGDCISFHRTYLDNEKSSMDLELNRSTMSMFQFNQEIMGEFLDDSNVFMNLAEAFWHVDLDTTETFCNKWSIPAVKTQVEGGNQKGGRKYVAGLDLAKEKDWSVLTIIDCTTGRIVYFERFQKMDYISQAQKVLAICKEYNNAQILFDITGGGTVVADILYNENKNPDQSLQGFTFTNDSKGNMIEKLKIRIQRDKEWIPTIPVLQSELQALQVKRTEMGKPKYEAPANQHDDCVMSLGMANLLYMEEVESPMVISIL